jgi:hypothetical protein
MQPQTSRLRGWCIGVSGNVLLMGSSLLEMGTVRLNLEGSDDRVSCPMQNDHRALARACAALPGSGGCDSAVNESVMGDGGPLQDACREYLGCMGPDSCKGGDLGGGGLNGNDCVGEAWMESIRTMATRK